MNEEITLFKGMDLAEGISGIVIKGWGGDFQKIGPSPILWEPIEWWNYTFSQIHLARQ